jgi:hypothetical protein
MRRFGALALVALAFTLDTARAMERRDLESELRLLEQGKKPELGIPGAKSRVAVFPYEDPDKTGLGNTLGSLVAREILLRGGVTSIGVLRYEGGLSPTTKQPLGYFDKVDLVTTAQQVTLSVWGAVRRSGDTLTIDTFVQIPPEQIDRSFRWVLRLPGAMGSGELVARLRPDRILVQRLEIPNSAESAFRDAARSADELRKTARADAEVVATVPIGSVYYVEKSEGDWSYINAGPGRAGWVPTRGSCTGDCASLLESARFAGGLLRYLDSKNLPEASPALGDDARAVVDQIRMLQVLNSERSDGIEAAWNKLEGEKRGAAFANLHAMARIAIDLKRGASETFERAGGRLQDAYEAVALDKARVLDAAFDLAAASQSDPRNTDILNNLAVLFAYSGDGRRADLARGLATAGTR